MLVLCRECEAYAHHIAKKPKGGRDGARPPKTLDFNTPEEKEKVNGIFELAMQCLSPQDRDLPIIHKMCHMFQCGIAVHHSGLLPILKELVEILFQEQLIKVLALFLLRFVEKELIDLS